MNLTNKEMEVMCVLWKQKTPMTAADIREASDDRSWKDQSIYVMMNKLVKKKLVKLCQHKATATKSARAYQAVLTAEKFMARYTLGIDYCIDLDLFIEELQAEHKRG